VSELSLARRVALELGVAEPSVFQEQAIMAMFAAEVREFVRKHELGSGGRMLAIARAIGELVDDEWRGALSEAEEEELDRWFGYERPQ